MPRSKRANKNKKDKKDKPVHDKPRGPDPQRPSDAARAMVPFSAEMGVSARSARRAILALAKKTGFGAHTLLEWSSADAPGADPHGPPPLYYAALLPNLAADDMPLGMGATPEAALGDLLWTLGAPLLLNALRDGDDPEPSWDDAESEELAQSGLW